MKGAVTAEQEAGCVSAGEHRQHPRRSRWGRFPRPSVHPVPHGPGTQRRKRWGLRGWDPQGWDPQGWDPWRWDLQGWDLQGWDLGDQHFTRIAGPMVPDLCTDAQGQRVMPKVRIAHHSFGTPC